MNKYERVVEVLCKATLVKKSKIVYKSFEVNEITIMRIRDILMTMGRIQEERLDEKIYTAVIPGGFFHKNYAVVTLQLVEDEILLVAYADEGLIKQNTCGGVIDEIGKKLERYLK